LFALAHINDGQQQRAANLLRGEADAVGGVHGLDHVGGKLADFRRDALDGLASFAQDGMTAFDDVQNHGGTILCALWTRKAACGRRRQKEDTRVVSLETYWTHWLTLLVEPFRYFGQVWLGILPLYVSLVLGELYKKNVSFAHAVGNGFVMLWAGLNWGARLSGFGWGSYMTQTSKGQMQIAWLVTAATVALGVFTIVLGFRKKDRTLCEVLGHTRFSCYFLILLYPVQSRLLPWDGMYLVSVLVFALPVWFVIYLLGRLVRAMIK